MSNLGTLYGLGVGPGDPELITVKAFRVIQESPVIAYPKKRKGSKSYAHRIVEV
ncbi:SAM-dependent methyltransferase, partial [Peribacillus sp. NPDC060186]